MHATLKNDTLVSIKSEDVREGKRNLHTPIFIASEISGRKNEKENILSSISSSSIFKETKKSVNKNIDQSIHSNISQVGPHITHEQRISNINLNKSLSKENLMPILKPDTNLISRNPIDYSWYFKNTDKFRNSNKTDPSVCTRSQNSTLDSFSGGLNIQKLNTCTFIDNYSSQSNKHDNLKYSLNDYDSQLAGIVSTGSNINISKKIVKSNFGNSDSTNFNDIKYMERTSSHIPSTPQDGFFHAIFPKNNTFDLKDVDGMSFKFQKDNDRRLNQVNIESKTVRQQIKNIDRYSYSTTTEYQIDKYNIENDLEKKNRKNEDVEFCNEIVQGTTQVSGFEKIRACTSQCRCSKHSNSQSNFKQSFCLGYKDEFLTSLKHSPKINEINTQTIVGYSKKSNVDSATNTKSKFSYQKHLDSNHLRNSNSQDSQPSDFNENLLCNSDDLVIQMKKVSKLFRHYDKIGNALFQNDKNYNGDSSSPHNDYCNRLSEFNRSRGGLNSAFETKPPCFRDRAPSNLGNSTERNLNKLKDIEAKLTDSTEMYDNKYCESIQETESEVDKTFLSVNNKILSKFGNSAGICESDNLKESVYSDFYHRRFSHSSFYKNHTENSTAQFSSLSSLGYSEYSNRYSNYSRQPNNLHVVKTDFKTSPKTITSLYQHFSQIQNEKNSISSNFPTNLEINRKTAMHTPIYEKISNKYSTCNVSNVTSSTAPEFGSIDYEKLSKHNFFIDNIKSAHFDENYKCNSAKTNSKKIFGSTTNPNFKNCLRFDTVNAYIHPISKQTLINNLIKYKIKENMEGGKNFMKMDLNNDTNLFLHFINSLKALARNDRMFESGMSILKSSDSSDGSYVCYVCNMKYIYKRCLVNHMRKKHMHVLRKTRF